jgi:hypothetical protein
MIIVCNGGYRTGSTLSYNLCVKVAELSGKEVFVKGASDASLKDFIKNHNQKEFWVIKSHDFMPDEVHPFVKIVHSYRHPYQSMASRIYRTKVKSIDTPARNIEIYMNDIKKQKDNFLKLSKRPDCLILTYDLMVGKMEIAIKKIAAHFGFPNLNKIKSVKENIIKIKKELSVENIKNFCSTIENADQRTQLRKNHIGKYEDRTDYWKEVLHQELIEQIIQELGLDYINSLDKID